MKNILKNKIIIILLFGFAFCLFIHSNSFASSNTTFSFYHSIYDLNVTLEVPDFFLDYSNIAIINHSSEFSTYDKYRIIGSNGRIYTNHDSDGVAFYGAETPCVFATVTTKTKRQSVVTKSDLTISEVSFTEYSETGRRGIYSGVEGTVFTANCTVYGSTLFDEDEVVFYPAPQEEGLAKVAKSIDFSVVLQQILKILPMVLIVVIGLLGLRKAIQLLLKTLETS